MRPRRGACRNGLRKRQRSMWTHRKRGDEDDRLSRQSSSPAALLDQIDESTPRRWHNGWEGPWSGAEGSSPYASPRLWYALANRGHDTRAVQDGWGVARSRAQPSIPPLAPKESSLRITLTTRSTKITRSITPGRCLSNELAAGRKPAKAAYRLLLSGDRPATPAEESSSPRTCDSRACRGCPKGWPPTETLGKGLRVFGLTKAEHDEVAVIAAKGVT